MLTRIYSFFLFCVVKLATGGLLWGPHFAFANNLQLTDFQLIQSNILQCTISWDNSWKLDSMDAPGNHDAVWVFGKSETTEGEWQALRMIGVNVVEEDSVANVQVELVEKGRGILVKRRSLGAGRVRGTFQLTTASDLALDIQELRLFGIEMVYVPEGAFQLGDSNSFHHFRHTSDGSPVRISSEATLIADRLSVGNEANIAGNIPETYPKGFSSFYIMKYEISQAQYSDFLNTLTFDQQLSRTAVRPDAEIGTAALAVFSANANRNGIVIIDSGIEGELSARYGCDGNRNGMVDEVDDGQTRACNFLNWRDLLAYLDWAGLRPMTELEFEKACRGPQLAISGEFAWGTPHIVDANTIIDDGLETERVSEQATEIAGLASHGFAGLQGPLRNGFGGSDSSNRLQIGAGFYGALELSGNLWELCIGVDEQGLLFEGQHGDGALTLAGEANAENWPLEEGGIHRGGAWNSGIQANFRDLAISDRFFHDLQPSLRRNTTGGRGVLSWNPSN